jgi:hypothetical protein
MVGVPSWIRYGLAFWGIASLPDGMIMKAKPQAVERFKKRREEKRREMRSTNVLGSCQRLTCKKQSTSNSRLVDDEMMIAFLKVRFQPRCHAGGMIIAYTNAAAREPTIEWLDTGYIVHGRCLLRESPVELYCTVRRSTRSTNRGQFKNCGVTFVTAL